MEKVGNKVTFNWKVLAYLLTINGMALRMNNENLSYDPDLTLYYQPIK